MCKMIKSTLFIAYVKITPVIELGLQLCNFVSTS